MTGKICFWNCFGIQHALDPQVYALLNCIALPRQEMKKNYTGPKSVHLPEMEENHHLCLRPVHTFSFRLIEIKSFLQLKNSNNNPKHLCGKHPVWN